MRRSTAWFKNTIIEEIVERINKEYRPNSNPIESKIPVLTQEELSKVLCDPNVNINAAVEFLECSGQLNAQNILSILQRNHTSDSLRQFCNDAISKIQRYPDCLKLLLRHCCPYEELFKQCTVQSKSNLDVECYNLILYYYGKREELDLVEQYRKEMKEQGITPNSKTMNILLQIYEDNSKKRGEILNHFSKFNLVPSIRTIQTLILQYARNNDYHNVEKTLNTMKALQVVPDLKLTTAIVSVYSKINRFDLVNHYVKVALQNNIELDCVLYNTIINMYCKNHDIDAASEYIVKMEMYGITPTIHTFTPLIRAYGELGIDIDSILEMIETRNIKLNNFACNILMKQYARRAEYTKIDNLIYKMKLEEIEFSIVTFNTLFSIFGSCRKYEHVDLYLTQLLQSGIKPDYITIDVLVNTYSRKPDFDKIYLAVSLARTHQIKLHEETIEILNVLRINST